MILILPRYLLDAAQAMIYEETILQETALTVIYWVFHVAQAPSEDWLLRDSKLFG